MYGRMTVSLRAFEDPFFKDFSPLHTCPMPNPAPAPRSERIAEARAMAGSAITTAAGCDAGSSATETGSGATETGSGATVPTLARSVSLATLVDSSTEEEEGKDEEEGPKRSLADILTRKKAELFQQQVKLESQFGPLYK